MISFLCLIIYPDEHESKKHIEKYSCSSHRAKGSAPPSGRTPKSISGSPDRNRPSQCHPLYVDFLSATPYDKIIILSMREYMDIKIIFGTNLKRYRTVRNLSQEKLAELSGLHRTYISDIERFQRSISLDNIQKIADALQIEAYLLFMEEKQIEKTDKNRTV